MARRPKRLQERLDALRAKGSVKSKEIEAFAKAVGRVKSKRGKEPNWINPNYPHLRPVSIPHHSTDLNKFTARGILNQLEEDIEAKESSALQMEEN